jgi:hypothetical protein
MSKKSVGEVSLKVSAHVQDAINDFNRVDNSVRRSVSRMDAELGKFAKSTKEKFSGANIGKSILGGLGIGSGFAAVNTIMGAVTSYMQEQAQHAKSIEDSVKKQLDYTKQIVALRQTGEQKIATLEEERASLANRIAAAANKGRFSQTTMDGSFKATTRMVDRPLSDKERADLAALNTEYTKLTLAIETLKKTREDTGEAEKTKEIEAAYNDLGKRVSSYLSNSLLPMIKAEQAHREARGKEDAALEATAQKYRDMADPLSKYKKELEEIESIKSRLNAGQYGANVDRVRGEMVDSELKAFFGEMDTNGKMFRATEKLSDAAKDLGWSFSSAFEDAILEAGKLKDVVNGLIKDIARIALRSMITAPIGNWLGGMFANFGGARAGGGDVSNGSTYLVGEKGPELFTPKGSGTIIPNHKLGSAGRGDTFNATYNIGAGVTAQQLMPILAMHKRDVISTLADNKRRRSGAMAGA